MKKIPTIFERDWDGDRSRVLDIPNPDCDWVFAGEGVATRKYDGTSCMVKDGVLYKRHEVRPGKPEPAGIFVNHDEETGKTILWVEVGDGPEDKWHREAFSKHSEWLDGTYELLGPKVQKNAEGFNEHRLVDHALAQPLDAPRTYDELALWLVDQDIEGIVWHHPDGRMAKIKKRDFGLKRVPVPAARDGRMRGMMDRESLIEAPEILDACCGGRMWWWEKEHPLACYMDVREAEKGSVGKLTGRPEWNPAWECKPDVLGDFRAMTFADESFQLVVFDPPHIVREKQPPEGINGLKYGALPPHSEQDDLRRGFAECWRVLAPGGTLVFKWAGPLDRVKPHFPAWPIVGSRNAPRGSSGLGTRWFIFYKPLTAALTEVAA